MDLDEKKVRPRGAVTNAGWNIFFTIWSIAISFLLTPLMIHYLGVDYYGILLLIWSITGILGIMNFGLGEATLRYVAHYYGERDLSSINRVFGATLSFNVVICVIVSASLFAAAPILVTSFKIPAGEYPLVEWLLRLSAIVFSLGLISRAFNAIPMALMRYDISTKINIAQSIARSIGYVVLVISKFGIIYLLIWDVITSFGMLLVQLVVAGNLLPGLKRMPSFSFKGLREIIGYSIFSFLTYVFLMMFRETGKLTLGTIIGPAPVAYLSTPDNVSQRAHGLVASGSETLLPRFSSNRDPGTARMLFLNSVWAALIASLIFFIPLIVLMTDFLSLWISPEFALESSAVGKLVALSYIAQGAFAPVATFFRGSGRPWFVTVVIFFAGVVTLISCMLLIPAYGVVGAGYAYVLGSAAHFLGTGIGWFYMFGASAGISMARFVGMPLLLGAVSFALESSIRARFDEVAWPGLFALGGLFAVLTALIVFGVDRIIGGDSPSKQLLEQIGKSRQVEGLFRYIRTRRFS